MSSGASTAADAAPPTREPLAVRLIGRGSLASAALVIAIAAAYGLVLPMVAAHAAAPPPPLLVDIGGGAAVTATDDWSEAVADGGATTLTQGGATLVISEPRASDLTVVESLADLTDDWIAEAPQGSVATAPRTFETDAGDSAATVVLQEPQQTIQVWVVSDGVSEVRAVLTSPPAAWEATSSAAQVMIRSLTFPATAS